MTRPRSLPHNYCTEFGTWVPFWPKLPLWTWARNRSTLGRGAGCGCALARFCRARLLLATQRKRPARDQPPHPERKEQNKNDAELLGFCVLPGFQSPRHRRREDKADTDDNPERREVLQAQEFN